MINKQKDYYDSLSIHYIKDNITKFSPEQLQTIAFNMSKSRGLDIMKEVDRSTEYLDLFNITFKEVLNRI